MSRIAINCSHASPQLDLVHKAFAATSSILEKPLLGVSSIPRASQPPGTLTKLNVPLHRGPPTKCFGLFPSFEQGASTQRGLFAAQLGLSPEDTRCVFSEAHMLVHNGADVSHLKSYRTIQGANVGSTAQLIQMSLEQGRLVPIHFVFTAAVSL
ncbi:hypothetical protein PspLS_10470 [Pyricularia sp. CBS 133598]|nr:hypothetical protein PspLS_10470 [Pyricularia sp. CBS 133598]